MFCVLSETGIVLWMSFSFHLLFSGFIAFQLPSHVVLLASNPCPTSPQSRTRSSCDILLLLFYDHVWESQIQLGLESLFLITPGPQLPVKSGYLCPVGSCIFGFFLRERALSFMFGLRLQTCREQNSSAIQGLSSWLPVMGSITSPQQAQVCLLVTTVYICTLSMS